MFMGTLYISFYFLKTILRIYSRNNADKEVCLRISIMLAKESLPSLLNSASGGKTVTMGFFASGGV